MQLLIQLTLKYKKDIYYILTLFFIFVFCAIYMGHVYGDIFMDCSRELYIPTLLLKGKILYKEIFGMYNPLSYQINAVLYLIFGQSFNVLYYAAYINAFLILLGLYCISRFFIGRYYSFVFVLLVMGLYVFRRLGVINYIFPYSYAIVYAESFFTFSVLVFLIYIKYKKRYFAYISALLLGLSLANKPEFFFCIIPIIGALIIKKESVKTVICTLLLHLIPSMMSYGILFLQGFSWQDFHNYMDFFKAFFKTNEQIYYSNIISPKWNLQNLQTICTDFLNTLYICVLGCLSLCPLRQKNKFKYIVFITIPMFIIYVISAFIQKNYYSNYFSWVIIANFVIFVFMPKRPLNQQTEMFYFLIFMGILSTARINFMPIRNHYGIYFLIPILTCWIYFITLKLPRLENFYYKKYVSIVLIIFSLMNIYSAKLRTNNYTKLKTAKGSIRLTKHKITLFSNVLKWVENNTAQTDSVLVMPEGLSVNYITGRPTKPLYYHLIPNHVSALGEKNVIKGLAEDKPDYIIITSEPYISYAKNSMCQDWGHEICNFVEGNYTETKKIKVPHKNYYAKVYKLNI